MAKNAKVDLLKENTKAFQFLHCAERMDFEKPYIIIKASGKFTFNSVQKALEKVSPDYVQSEYVAGVMMQYGNGIGYSKKLHYVTIRRDKFSVERLINVQYWKFDIDYFFTIGNFESNRKANTSNYYIIAQKKSLLCAKLDDENIDLMQRFKIDKQAHIINGGNGSGLTWISQIPLILRDGSAQKFSYEPFRDYWHRQDITNDITRIVDKSGYITIERRRELSRRADALRKKRDKEVANATRYTDREKAICAMIEEKKKSLAHYVAETTNADTMLEYGEKIRKLSYIMRDYENHINRTENARYDSVEAIECTLSLLERDLGMEN